MSDLQIAHNERRPDKGPGGEGDPHLGRADTVDRDVLARVVSSISRFLTPEQAVSLAAGVEVLDSRRIGG